MGVGAALIVAAVTWQLQATLWLHHSNVVGNALVKKAKKLQTHAGSCSRGSSSVSGILEIPKIALVAPVQQGTSDSVLNVAVGHDPYSVWPGTNGTAVFNAHDVSYFLHIDKLKAGDLVVYQTACDEYEFTVESHSVVKAGAPVYNTAGPSITLVTCWPTNALWFTPDRYLVSAVEVAKRSIATPTTAPTAILTTEAPPSVAIPAALENQGLTLKTNYAPMGSMTIGGSPSRFFSQSPGPLNMEFSALKAYFGGLKALGQKRLDWWHGIAPGVTPPADLVGASVSGYVKALDVLVKAHGDVPTGVTLSTEVNVAGGSAPGAYDEVVDCAIKGGHLTVTRWSLTIP